MTERKLASVRKISALKPIEGADLIEVATIDGWKIVVKKDEFKVDELVCYLAKIFNTISFKLSSI